MDKDFTLTTLKLQDDYEGEVIATLIASKSNTGQRASVLYLHGYVDYFFHPHVSQQFINHNIDFYALDLRKYGRSLLSHQHPNYCRDMKEYYEEIDLALNTIKKDNDNDIYLLGHSTGGLLACNYMNEGSQRKSVTKLILNSPFLKFNQTLIENFVTKIVARTIAKFSSYAHIKGALASVYAESIHKDYYGEWDFNLKWKPIEGFATYFTWLVAILNAQDKLLPSKIEVPILLMHSSKSKKLSTFSEEAMSSDIVLNVQDMKEIGPKLGKNIELLAVVNAQHDIFLSPKKVREKAFKDVFKWLA